MTLEQGPELCVHPADDLVASIRKAMKDETMAENLERVHNTYLDTQETPVDKVGEG